MACRRAGTVDLYPVGQIAKLPDGKTSTGPLGPLDLSDHPSATAQVVVWRQDANRGSGWVQDASVYYPKPTAGNALLVPGDSPTFKGVRGTKSSRTSWISFR